MLSTYPNLRESPRVTQNTQIIKAKKPFGIQVVRTESLLFRLLKAVFIPMTMRYFLFLVNSGIFTSSVMGEPLSIESCKDLAAASSISKFEIVLSSVLYFYFQILEKKENKESNSSNLQVKSMRNILYSMMCFRNFP